MAHRPSYLWRGNALYSHLRGQPRADPGPGSDLPGSGLQSSRPRLTPPASRRRVQETKLRIHREGYPFIAGFAVATLILFLLWEPLGWIGVVLTLWCVWFFRDPDRITPRRP